MAERAGVRLAEVEVVCSDREEHRKRVEGRRADIPGHALPSWQEALGREYHPWERDRVVIDTAAFSAVQAVEEIMNKLPHQPW